MRRAIGLSIAVGLLVLGQAETARAQFSYGYDSFNYGGYQPSMTYYYSSGYSRLYTDPSNGMGGNGYNVAGPRTIAPYVQPPYGSFSSSGRLPSVYAQGVAAPLAVNRAPARALVPAQAVPAPAPRGPIRRIFRRR